MNSQDLKNALTSLPKPILSCLRLILIFVPRMYIRYFPLSLGKSLLYNKLSSHLWWLERPTIVRTQSNQRMHVDPRDLVGKYLFYFGTWEPALTAWMKSRLRLGDTFIDVGANIGYFSVTAGALVGPQGSVIAIEAHPSTYKVLLDNLALNGLSQARAVNLAAWHKEDTLEIFSNAEFSGGTTTVVPNFAEQWNLRPSCTVFAKPLSSIITLKEIRSARMLKIDVEGAEWSVIQGLVAILDQSQKDLEIVIEVSPAQLELQGQSLKRLVEIFGEFGFHPYRIANDYSVLSYVHSANPQPPTRITAEPSGSDQYDLVFSRSDVMTLS
jgi:FkbM family methyltransferase